MKTMKALVKTERKKGLWLQEVPVPIPGADEVLIKIQKTAICGTDLHIYNWDEWSQNTIKTPLVVGHEFAGVIEELGSLVKGFKVGDVVSGEGHIVCGACRNCLAGRQHLCPNTEGVGIHRAGAYAEYLVIPATNVWLANPKIPTDQLAYFDPLGNAVHTALSFDVVGEDVLITGAGPIGLMAIPIAKHAGARHVVITDVNDYRLNLAKEMGATRAVNVMHEELSEVQKELDMKEGFDVALEMSGSPAAFNQLLDNVRVGSRVALLGILPKDTKIDWGKAIFNSLTFKCIYGREMYETWYKMSSMLLSGMDVSKVLTHRFNFKDFEKGFEVMNSGQCGKVILDWEV